MLNKSDLKKKQQQKNKTNTTESGCLNYGKEGENQFNIVLAENSAHFAQSPGCPVH